MAQKRHPAVSPSTEGRKEFRPHDAELVLIPGDPSAREPGSESALRYEQVRASWRRVWEPIFRERGQELDEHNFLRQSVIVGFFQGPDLIGYCLGNFITLADPAFREHAYVRNLPDAIRGACEGWAQRRATLMTGEYLAVEPAFRRTLILSLTEFLVAATYRYFLESSADILVNTSRRDVGVAQVCQRFAFKELAAINRYNLDCSFLVFDKSEQRPRYPEAVRFPLEHYWLKRQDLTRPQPVLRRIHD